MDWTAVGLTLRLATATTVVLVLFGVPVAYWLATTRRRGRWLVESLVALPILLPPTVLGFYLLLLLGPRSPVGAASAAVLGHSLPFSFAGLLVASAVFNLPFAVRPFVSAFAAVDRRFLEAAWCLGESRTRAALRVALPLAWPGILTGVVLSFAHTVGEFGVVLMVGGNIPGVTQTISMVIYDDVQAMNYAAAHQTSAVLLGFSFLALCVISALQRRVLPL
jgi:molybdate transport system permease protein